jgi:hypothetical protein
MTSTKYGLGQLICGTGALYLSFPSFCPGREPRTWT